MSAPFLSTIKTFGGPEHYHIEVKDREVDDPFYPGKQGYGCDSCHDITSTQYEYTILTQVGDMTLESCTYLCQECHDACSAFN
jgi:hypothetical protein